MGIYDKLEEIRRKPEHIRLRYVWSLVAVSMVLVLAIWILSFRSSQEVAAPAMEGIDASKITDQLNQGKESLQNATEGFQNAFEQQQAAQQLQQDQQKQQDQAPPGSNVPDASSVDVGNTPDLSGGTGQ